ncbi:hypothetical protein DSO57_1001809 [Entomophthora muscae]|uniref:Uncharacterized protein n=1 Tax=Entomophthora muscae TaxID=34485 RepID=A0ACC2U8J4_9FUNG|nr:hypothetical protein DSO57_1001809 [Entomophthora muscae]
MLSPLHKAFMVTMVPIFLLFWTTPQIPTILTTLFQLSWIGPYPEDISSFPESGTDESPFLDLHNTKLTTVPSHSLPSLHQVSSVSPDIHPTWDCSLWLLTGSFVMGLDIYFPPFSQPASFGRPLQAAISILHWMASWWLVLPEWEPDFVSLAPLSYTVLFRDGTCHFPSPNYSLPIISTSKGTDFCNQDCFPAR